MEDERDDELQLNPGARGPFDFLARANIHLPSWLKVLTAVMAVAILSVLLFWVLPRRRWNAVERVYADLVVLARLLGVRPRASETPLEYGGRVAGTLPEVRGEVSSIACAFSQQRYRRACGGGTEGLGEAWPRVAQAIGRALPRVWLSRAGL
jgi:hypothetical protein